MTAPEPTTCESCQESDEGNPIHHHALIRALEKERDGLRAKGKELANCVDRLLDCDLNR